MSTCIEDAAAEAAEFIVIDQDVKPSSVEVDVTSIIIGERDFLDAIHDVTASRVAAKQAEAEAQAKTRSLARDLPGANVPVRDIGEALGLPYQRAHQLLSR